MRCTKIDTECSRFFVYISNNVQFRNLRPFSEVKVKVCFEYFISIFVDILMSQNEIIKATRMTSLGYESFAINVEQDYFPLWCLIYMYF